MGPNDSSKKYFDVAKPRIAPAAASTAPTLNKPKRQMISVSDDDKPAEESQPISNIDDENQPYDDTLMDQPEASEPSANAVSHPDLEVPSEIKKDDETDSSKQPEILAEPEKPVEDAPYVNPLPGTIDEEKPAEVVADETSSEGEAEVQEEPKEEPAEKSAGEKVIEPIGDKENIEKPTEEKPQPDTPAPPPERFSAIDALPEEVKDADDAKQETQDPSIYDTKEYYVPIGNTHHSHGGLKMAFAFGLLCAVIVVGAIIFYMLEFAK